MSALRSEIPELDRLDAGMVRAFVRALKPRVVGRPSEYAAANLRLDATQGASVQGRFDPGYLPWVRAWMDALYDFPRYKGVAGKKRAQYGLTLGRLAALAASIAGNSGGHLYLIGREEDADAIAAGRWSPFTQCEALRDRFDKLAEGDRRAQKTYTYPYDSGVVNFATAKSASAVSTHTYRLVIIDEYDQCQRNFPKVFGDLLPFAEARTLQVRVGSEVWLFSHPTDDQHGIAVVYREQSTQHRWVFDCPRCGGPCDLDSTCIVFEKIDADGRKDPASHWVRCPACKKDVPDDERRRRVWEGTGPYARAGGSGRLWSPLPVDEQHRRDYLGFAVNGLMDPDHSSLHYAKMLAAATTPEATRSTLNTHFGEEVKTGAATAVNAEMLERLYDAADLPALPGGRLGVKFATIGGDVQAPRDNPHLYLTTLAFTATGKVFVTEMRRVRGFAAFHEYVRLAAVRLTDGAGDAVKETIGVRGAALDDRYEGGQVKDTCRTAVYSAASNGRVQLVPVGNAASTILNADNPFVLRKEDKRRHPTRPDLGLIEMFDLHRHSWVDRVLSLITDGRLLVVANLDGREGRPTRAEVNEQLASQVLTARRELHTRWQEGDTGVMEWDRADNKRDDWLMAIVYGIFLAAAKFGLDRIYDDGSDTETTPKPVDRRKEWFSHGRGKYWR
ncbi:MAG: phage terminase large subunit family protein [Phycisphaerales bacterium]